MYNPPENCLYNDISIFDQIENTIIDICSENSDTEICLLGDFNARTGLISDIIEIVDVMHEDDNVILDIDEASCTIAESSKARSNSDRMVNNMGRRLIDMCRSLNLHIMNDRYGADRGAGKPTCKKSSTVDYVIISEKPSEIIIDFEILEYDGTLSDIHCPIYFSFEITSRIPSEKPEITNETNLTCGKVHFKWNVNAIEVYKANISKKIW